MRKRASRWQATLFCPVNVLAEQGPDTLANPYGRSVSEFVAPEGRFDLEAARLSGFEGSLDLDDANLQFDPRTGAPRIRPSTALTPTDDPDDIYWESLGLGVNGDVYALTVVDGKLIAGGGFSMASGRYAFHIASWTGSNWVALWSGLNDPVSALTVYDGKLIAGGFFTTAGGGTANH
ncbi:MAG: hypothetical protein NTW07_07380, partial [candidate division Zixibacteria bacterium]|nr:hypothetical protein [candidate division Zixibacteria bacterium]